MNDKVGFVGLGQMGKWMALNILKKNHLLTVYDLSPEAVSELEAKGAKPAGNLKELAASCGIIILCLPDAGVVEGVVFGSRGLAGHLKAGQVIIDCSTTGSIYAQQAALKLKEDGVVFLDAPISGMVSKARAGELTIMVGGPEEVLDRVRPLLEAMGANIVHLGQVGNGQLAKTLNNALFNISCAAMAEILPVAVKMGIPAGRFCSLVSSSTGQSFGFDFFSPLVMDRNFEPGYPLEKAYKDMTNLAELSALENTPLPVFSASLQTYQMALSLGLGSDNKGAMTKVWEKMLGVKVEAD